MNWTELIPTDILLVVISSISTWLINRGVNKANAKKLEVEISESILKTYKAELDSMKNRIEEYVSRISDLEKTVEKLQIERNDLRMEVNEFEKKYGKQTKTHKNTENDFVKIDADSKA